MRKIKEIMRLKFDAELSHEQIVAAHSISKDVVTKYVGLVHSAGMTLSEVQKFYETQLQHCLLSSGKNPRDLVQPDFDRVHQELCRKGMTLVLLWEEYCADHADHRTYAYSQYCDKYRRFAMQLKHSMRQIHRFGEKLFIEFAGQTIAVTDGSRANIFVAALGALSYTIAYATERKPLSDWLSATARAFQFYAGVLQLIIPNNPKAMMSDASRSNTITGTKLNIFKLISI